MFKDKFNQEMQNIKASDERKAELLDEIKAEQEQLNSAKPKMTLKKRSFIALAAMLAVVIVSVSVFNLPLFNGNGKVADTGSGGDTSAEDEIVFPTFAHTKGIPANVSYGQIYQLFSAIYKTEHKKYSYTTGTYTADGYVVEEYEMEGETVDDGEALPGGMGGELKGENTTAKPDSATDVNESINEDAQEDYSTTNTQVEEVDEADVVKTDGKYIYSLNVRELKINVAKAEKGKLTKVSTIYLSEVTQKNQKYFYGSEMYVTNGRLVILYQQYSEKNYTIAIIYDISNPKEPKMVREVAQSGSYLSSRVIGNKLYYFTNEYINEKPNENDKCSYVPCTAIDGDAPTPIDDANIYMFDGEVNRSYLTAVSVDLTTGNIVDTKTALGGGSQLYANTKSVYVTAEKSSYSYAAAAGKPELATKYEHSSRIMRFSINDGKITAVAEGVVAGSPLNQFSMDEHNGYFRIVTTRYDSYSTSNGVYILDSNLNQVGAIENIAKDERVYSVRFMGDTGYFVTFRQVDPLFAVDLSNPKEPKILSALKIPGFSNYLHPWGEGMLLGIGLNADEKTGSVGNVKLSMFDISNPNNVTESNKFIAEYSDSTVGTNHKSVLVSRDKNLIGFTIMQTYSVFSFDAEKGFKLEAELKAPELNDMYYYGEATRGIYIGDYLYICNYNGIISYSLSDFKEVDSLIF